MATTAGVNPFRPSFGTTPTVVAGRESLVANVSLALREGPGSPYRFTLISGARGAGKTVLLNLLEDEARTVGWRVIRVPASRDLITELRDVDLPRLLRTLDGAPPRRTITGAAAPVESLRTRLREVCTLLTERSSGLFLTLDELQSATPGGSPPAHRRDSGPGPG